MTDIKSASSKPVAEPPRNPRIMLIHNPAAGRGRGRLQTTLARLRSLGSVPEVWATARRGEAEALARAAVERGYDLVVVAGGDGTVNEVVNGLAGSGLAGSALPLALLPLGTANVLATEIGLDLAPELFENGKIRSRDLDADGCLDPRSKHVDAGLDRHRPCIRQAGEVQGLMHLGG